MIWAAVFGALSVVLTVYFVAEMLGPKGSIGKKKRIKERIFQHQENLSISSIDVEKKTRFSDIKSFQQLLIHLDFAKKMALELQRAGYNLSLSLFLLIHFSVASLIFLISNLFLPITSSIPLALSFVYFPFLYLRKKNRDYINKFSEYLSDSVSILSGSLKVGHSLETALESVSAEIRLGLPVETAFENLYQRFKTPELKILTTAISIHQELGGNLSELLDNLEKTIRERFAMEREVKVLSAQGVMSMWVLTVLPFVFGFMWLWIDKGLLIEFVTSSMGTTFITASLVMQVTAFIWMKRIVLIIGS